jgi:hypothetical protein
MHADVGEGQKDGLECSLDRQTARVHSTNRLSTMQSSAKLLASPAASRRAHPSCNRAKTAAIPSVVINEPD